MEHPVISVAWGGGWESPLGGDPWGDVPRGGAPGLGGSHHGRGSQGRGESPVTGLPVMGFSRLSPPEVYVPGGLWPWPQGAVVHRGVRSPWGGWWRGPVAGGDTRVGSQVRGSTVCWPALTCTCWDILFPGTLVPGTLWSQGHYRRIQTVQYVAVSQYGS